jgi:hypothetical protein
MSQTLETLRSLLVAGGENINDSDYSDTQKDYALYQAITVARREIRKPLEKATSITITNNDPTLDLTGTWADFQIPQLVAMGISYYPTIEVVDYATVAAQLHDNYGGRPERLAFLGPDDAYLDRFPNQEYTAWATRVPPLTAWTWGTASPGAVSIDIDLEIAMPTCWYLAPAILQHRDKDMAYGDRSYVKGIQEIRAIGGQSHRRHIVKHRDIL